MEIKERIKQLLSERNWSLSKLAKTAGISEHAVYNWFNEKNYTPSRDAINDVCEAFGISLAEFYADIDIDRLTENEIKLLEWFKKVPEHKQTVVLDVIKSLAQ